MVYFSLCIGFSILKCVLQCLYVLIHMYEVLIDLSVAL